MKRKIKETGKPDLADGRYRKMYAQGLINGQRINSVSVAAAWWFVQINMISDGHGNFRCDWINLKALAAPKRKEITPRKAEALTKELEEARLIGFYDDSGEKFCHIYDFGTLQPAGKNGVPVQDHPREPVAFRKGPPQSKETGLQQEKIPRNPTQSHAIPLSYSQAQAQTHPHNPEAIPKKPNPTQETHRTTHPPRKPHAPATRPGGGGGGSAAPSPEQEQALAALAADPFPGISGATARRLIQNHPTAVILSEIRWGRDARGRGEKIGGGLIVTQIEDGTAADRLRRRERAAAATERAVAKSWLDTATPAEMGVWIERYRAANEGAPHLSDGDILRSPGLLEFMVANKPDRTQTRPQDTAATAAGRM